MLLPQEYIIQKFYQHAGYPKYKKSTNTYEAGCPICREGASWLKKSRCYYIVDQGIICCHNCGWYGKPLKWIQEVSNQTYEEVIREAKTFDVLPTDVLQEENKPGDIPKIIHKLPLDCINLFDSNQTYYHKDNPIIQKALELIKKRRLDTAVNRPNTLWLSLTDNIHKNRLIIPFYNETGDIVFYQSRTIIKQTNDKLPKYLSKINGEKSLFNLDKISSDNENIFIFEGPIDAFFVKNSTAVAGIQENSNNMFSTLQHTQINGFKTHNRIWVLDSQWLDKASKTKTKRLIDAGETVFVWPEKIGTLYKDFNDACIATNIDEISSKFILDNSYSGLKAKLLMSEIKN